MIETILLLIFGVICLMSGFIIGKLSDIQIVHTKGYATKRKGHPFGQGNVIPKGWEAEDDMPEKEDEDVKRKREEDRGFYS